MLINFKIIPIFLIILARNEHLTWDWKEKKSILLYSYFILTLNSKKFNLFSLKKKKKSIF